MKDQQFDLDLTPGMMSDLNINKNFLLSRGIHCTKYCNIQAKGLKDIERRLTDQVQNNMSPSFKGGVYKNKIIRGE